MSKVKYCNKCCTKTVHKLVGHDSIGEGMWITRVILAVGSLGLSETVCADWHYQCTKCGTIRTE